MTTDTKTTAMDYLRVTTCAALVLALGNIAGADDAIPGPRADCVLATIGGVSVTEADADAIRALLSPPPAAAATRRLAVDTALAWWDIHGWLAGSSAGGRLDAWRAWLSVGTRDAAEALDAGRAAADIAKVAARAGMEPGVCGDALATVPAPHREVGEAGIAVGPSDRGRRSAELLRRSNKDRDPRSVRILRILPAGIPQEVGSLPAGADLDRIAATMRQRGLESELRDVTLPLRQLDRALALTLATLPDGGTAGPIRTSSGLYWLERR